MANCQLFWDSLCYLCCHSALPLNLWTCVISVVCSSPKCCNAIAPKSICWQWSGDTVCSSQWGAYIQHHFSLQTLQGGGIMCFWFLFYHMAAFILWWCQGRTTFMLLFALETETKDVRTQEAARDIFHIHPFLKGRHFANKWAFKRLLFSHAQSVWFSSSSFWACFLNIRVFFLFFIYLT